MSDSCSNEPDTTVVESPQIPSEPQLNGLEERPHSIDTKTEKNEDKVEFIPSSQPSQEQLLRKFIDDERKLNQADYTKRFYMIRLEQEALRQEAEYASITACNPCHYMRNRYRDILPYDHNRVVLSKNEENPDGYMNASLIKLPGGRTQFIAAQAPLPNTIDEWWQMIAEQKIELVIMLCKLMEMSKVKCERYWPELKGESKIWGNFEITFVEEERFSDGDYLLRVLKIDNTESGESRIMRQLHYVEWPDHGCPSGEDQLLNMIDKMAEFHLDESIPVLVHCSAGVGRTGTIIAVNHIRELLASESLFELNLFDLVMSLRKQRASMVQTQDQYQFVHKCVARYARKKLGIPDPQMESPPPFRENETKEPKLIDFSSDESDNESTAVPDFPEEPRSRPQGPEELGSAAAS